MQKAIGTLDRHIILLRKAESDNAAACRHHNILLAFTQVADRIRPDSAAGLNTPQQLTVDGVQSKEITLHGSREHQVAGGRKHSAPRRRVYSKFPLRLAGFPVQRAQRTPRLLAGDRQPARSHV